MKKTHFVSLLAFFGVNFADKTCKTDKKLTGQQTIQRCDPWNLCYNEEIFDYRYDDIICDNAQTKFPLHVDKHACKSTIARFLRSNLSVIQAGWLDQLAHTEIVYLNNSHIETIEPGAFNAFTKLDELYLENNNITQIHRGTFNSLIPLQELNMSNNQITLIDQYSFNGLSKLETLDLSNNNISFINLTTFYTCENLVELNLSYNNITSLFNATFRRQVKLKQLNLAHNKLENIPRDFFTNMTSLNDVILSNNLIKSVHFEQLIGNVYLENNVITSLSKLGPKIRSINLSNNSIKYLPANTFRNTKELCSVTLHHNLITKIHVDAFKNFKSVNTLQLTENNIDKIEIGTFKDLENLTTLNMSSNQIAKLEYGIFTGLSSLENLDISRNNIEYLEMATFYPLQQLISLNISKNSIMVFEVEKILEHLISLSELSLQGNKWNCEWLTNAIQQLKRNNVTVLHGKSHKDTNVNGIACTTDDKSRSPYRYIHTSPNLTQTDTLMPSSTSLAWQSIMNVPDIVNGTGEYIRPLTKREHKYEMKQFGAGDSNRKILTFIAVIVSFLVIIQVVKIYQDCKFKSVFMSTFDRLFGKQIELGENDDIASSIDVKIP